MKAEGIKNLSKSKESENGMKRKRILYINVSHKNGSTGRLIDSIVSSPEAEDTEYMVMFQQGNNENEYSFRFENRFESILRRGTHRFFGNLEWVTVPETRRLIKKIKEFNPDLIHIHTLHHQCTNYLMLFNFLKEFEKPVIITVHDCWIYTGGCYHYTKFGCRQFETGCQNCKRDPKRLDCKPKQTEKKLREKCEYYNTASNLFFVGVSEWICSEIKRSMIKNPNIICIKNGIDTDIFRNKKNTEEVIELRKRLKNGRAHLVLGVANQWSEGKGLSRFTELAQRLGGEYQVILVGGGLPAKVPADNVCYYGLTYDAVELADIYNAAELLVNLSSEESFGLVSVEAAACGTDVIGFDSTANTEVLNEIGGTLIEEGRYDKVYSAILAFFDEDKRSSVKDIKETCLTKSAMVQAYWKLYNKVVEMR